MVYTCDRIWCWKPPSRKVSPTSAEVDPFHAHYRMDACPISPHWMQSWTIYNLSGSRPALWLLPVLNFPFVWFFLIKKEYQIDLRRVRKDGESLRKKRRQREASREKSKHSPDEMKEGTKTGQEEQPLNSHRSRPYGSPVLLFRT